jgi:hypothetical protein
MKSQIFGRKVGSGVEPNLLISSNGASAGGNKKANPTKLRQFEIESTRRAVKALQEKSIEGYVLFEGDTQQYSFTPDSDFVGKAEQNE